MYDEDRYRAAYERHDEAVRAFFEDSPDLLEVDLTKDPSWERLCAFLRKPVPDAAFPFSNRGSGPAAGRAGDE